MNTEHSGHPGADQLATMGSGLRCSRSGMAHGCPPGAELLSIKLGCRSRSIPESPMADHPERPTKICPVCGRPFQWRKKWKDVWEEVRYCSERCRRRRSNVADPC